MKEKFQEFSFAQNLVINSGYDRGFALPAAFLATVMLAAAGINHGATNLKNPIRLTLSRRF